MLSGVTEKRQGSEIHTTVWVFQLLLADIVDAKQGGFLTSIQNLSVHASARDLLHCLY